MSNIAEQVIEAFGGLTKAARAINAPISTVDSWSRSGRIPKWRKDGIVAAAERDGVTLPPEFVPTEKTATSSAGHETATGEAA